MTRRSRTERLAAALLAARDPDGVLGALLAVESPQADLAVLWAADGRVAAARRRAASGEWARFPMPPLQLGEDELKLAGGKRRAGERVDAVDDLLASLSLEHELRIGLGPPEPGLLVLARALRPFGVRERAAIERHAGLIGRALEEGSRRAALEQGNGQELASLLTLTRSLATAVTLDAALDAAAACLLVLLRPCCGAVIAALDASEPPRAVAWPDGHCDEAVRRGAAAAGFPAPHVRARAAGHGRRGVPRAEHWIELEDAEEPVALALAWNAPPPPSARRVMRAVIASLRLALIGLRAQRSREESRLGASMEHLPLGIVLLDAEARVRIANPVGRRLLEVGGGVTDEEGRLVRLGPAEVPEDSRASLCDGPREIEISASQSGRTIVARLFPVAGSGDGERETILVLEDVTEERKRARQWLQVEKLSALGTLMAGIVHEINQPLTTILGYAQMLTAELDEPRAAHWIRTLSEEARRCQRIVRDMLDVARPKERGRHPLALESIAGKALSLMAHPLRKAGVEVAFDVEPGLPEVSADPDEMLRVVLNLLTNALHALENAPGERRLAVCLGRAESGELLLTIEDNGPGIPPDIQDKVFLPFFTTKEEGKGSGLGLSLVATAVREHGGQVDLDSTPGIGTRFTVRIPVEDRASARSRETAEPAPRPAPPLARAERLAGRRILVAEDDDAVAELVGELLGVEGAEVVRAGDGLAAYKAFTTAASGPFDAMLCDLGLPGLGGEELLERLRGERPDLVGRVVLATGDLRSSAGRSVFERRGRPCLAKPFDREALVDTLRRVAGIEGSVASPKRPRTGAPRSES